MKKLNLNSKQRFEEIQLNRVRLDSCQCHKFDTSVEITLGGKVKCLNCGGEMSLIEASQYIRGFSAAGGDANKVWVNWINPGEEVTCRCPQCFGRNFVEPRPGDFFDCDLCDSTGVVSAEDARNFLKEIDNNVKP